MEQYIRERVHRLYWENDLNCARTALVCLAQLLGAPVAAETLRAAIGLHGAGGFRAQCGLVEGPLMFLGVYFSAKGKDETEIARLCYAFAEQFEREFGSLLCRDLRPGGFSEKDPPHACEALTADAIVFAYRYIAAVSSSAMTGG